MAVHKSVFVFFTIAALVWGCQKSEQLPTKIADQKVGVGLPLINSTLSLQDAVPKDSNFVIKVNPDGYYSFEFIPDAQKFPKAEDYIVLKDIDVLKSNALPAVPVIGLGNVASQTFGPFTMSISGLGANDQFKNAKLNRIIFKGGTMKIRMKSTYSKRITVTLDLLSLKKNNVSKSVIIELNNNGGASIEGSSETVDLTGYTLDLTGNAPGGANQIQYSMSISVETGGVVGEVSFIEFSFKNQLWSRIDGKLGTVVFPIAENASSSILATQDIALIPFKNNDNADPTATTMSFDFENPKMYGKLYNTFGIPCKLIITPIRAIGINGQDLNTINYSDSIPLAKLIAPGTKPVATSFTVPGSLLKTLFNKGPKEVKYSLSIALNGNSTSSPDYILDSSRISAEPIIELPLFGKFTLFNLRNEIENSLYESKDATTSASFAGMSFNAKEARLVVKTENSIPFGYILQISLLDKNKVPLRNADGSLLSIFNTKNGTSTISGMNLRPANVDVNGFSTGMVPDFQYVSVSESVFTRLKKEAKYLSITARISSNDGVSPLTNAHINKSVKVRPQDKIKIQLSAAVQGFIQFENK